MKKTVIKALAGISASVMLSSMAVFAAPAVNAAYEEEEAEAYIASMEDEEAQKVAQYFWNEGFSLEELKATMERYCSGRAMEEERKVEETEETASLMSTSPFPESSYYTTDEISGFTHYLLLLTDSVNQQLDYY